MIDEANDEPTFSDSEHQFPVYRKAPAGIRESSPAIIVMHEVPGIYPAVIDFAERLIAEGYTVYMPSLLGEPGKAFSIGYTLASLGKACISREFRVLAGRLRFPFRCATRSRASGTVRFRRPICGDSASSLRAGRTGPVLPAQRLYRWN